MVGKSSSAANWSPKSHNLEKNLRKCTFMCKQVTFRVSLHASRKQKGGRRKRCSQSTKENISHNQQSLRLKEVEASTATSNSEKEPEKIISMMHAEDESFTVAPTTEKSKSIQAIDKGAVHRICSGQVVLNLATAVKELVENSLDAGATSIEIRLREYGSELVEVVDNGCGVEEANFAGLTLKHHTSKLREFSDLLGVETFGFRGEALSSLCALSDLTVTTRHSSSSMATKLTYDSQGLIVSKSLCARQVGTTVVLANLFSSLPVRQKEFLRNLKREFFKMSQLLQAYCLISTGVKIICSNQTKKGSKTVVISTQGSLTYKGNIMCIFGAKQASGLLDIEMESPSADHLETIGLSSNNAKVYDLEGCISSCAHGQGRSSTDRQFYYINNRPCDPAKVSKVVNEVYHQFNMHQFPFVFLNIKTARDSVDINVTPDKRQIFLDNEKLLLATVRASLLKLYEKIPNTFQVQNVFIGPSLFTDNELSKVPVPNSSSPLPTSKSTNSRIARFSSLLKTFSHSQNKSDLHQDQTFSLKEHSPIKSGRGIKRPLASGSCNKDGKKQLCLSDFVSKECNSVNNESLECNDSSVASNLKSDTLNKKPRGIGNSETYCEEDKDETKVHVEASDTTSTSSLSMVLPSTSQGKKLDAVKDRVTRGISSDNGELDYGFSEVYENRVPEGDSLPAMHISDTEVQDLPKPLNLINVDTPRCSTSLPVSLDSGGVQSFCRKTIMLDVNMSKLLSQFQKYKATSEEKGSKWSTDGKPRVRFYTAIDPSKNKSAEQELNKEISKDMFSKMEIIGQFNLGFIITKLDQDLFIVDQHATDEKYNFETLQTQTTIKHQKLVIPQALELTAVNECILMDNLEIFTKNGFSFVIDQEAAPTKRIRLAAKPISHNWEFGKEDIDELLFMLQDSPQTMCRPSRVRAMFASRACRKSVMIGTALSKSTMRQLVNHMGEIEQPWNCPHGRPTMRHLVNLELVRKRK